MARISLHDFCKILRFVNFAARTLRCQYERDFAYLELRSGRLFCEPKFIDILPKLEPDIRPSDKNFTSIRYFRISPEPKDDFNL
ncbi:hypothetical protein [uncultured Campylobacter sp.]|uniref:hypothetical protein n=1 Tax=uncultured Campylobacter sp. TaxID=218934 RepID=UPI0028E75B9C|nr:hypothetical protein [uncultured Campylobacter sp.]